MIHTLKRPPNGEMARKINLAKRKADAAKKRNKRGRKIKKKP